MAEAAGERTAQPVGRNGTSPMFGPVLEGTDGVAGPADS
jgi:hypothetical protein